MNLKSSQMKHLTFKKILIAFVLVLFIAVLFTGLVVLIKYFLATLSGLYEPVFNWFKLVLSEKKVKNGFIFQTILILKLFSLLISGGFIFVIYSALSTAFSCFFYKLCSIKHKKNRHPLKFSILKGIKWNFYRAFLVLFPPISVIAALILLISSSVLLFNFLLKIAGISITLTTFLVSFILFSMIFLFLFSLLVSLWQLVSTIFGTEIAVSEPKLSYKTIEERAKKLIFSKNFNILLCISYFMLIYNIFIQLKYLLISDFLTNPSSQIYLNYIILYNFLCLGVFEYLKAANYINSLMEHHKKISKSLLKVFDIKYRGNSK